MDLSTIHNVYFIGIGGIGMSALARYFKNAGKNVAGYDKTPSALTSEMIASGIQIHFEDNIELIPETFQKNNTLIVITPAVPVQHFEWNHFNKNGFQILKRSQVLGLITKGSFCFAVAGTHGKTTTSAILGHILMHSNVNVTAFVGGIVENYGSNLIGNGSEVTVVEADEFDRSFLHLHPNIACVTSTDADHLDIYGDSASIEASFSEFADKISDKLNLLVATGLALKGTTIGIDSDADYNATNIRIENSRYIFDMSTPDGTIADVKFALPGRHNLMNALMASAMGRTYGISDENIVGALESFRGIRRRFSYQIQRPNLVFIDDYAHHPTEINAVYQAIRELYPNKKVLAIFQPHLFSRTKDFADDFAKSLSAFDKVLLLDIYPARELPLEGITSTWLLGKISTSHKALVSKENLNSEVLNSSCEVILTIGAGDIGELVEPLKNALI